MNLVDILMIKCNLYRKLLLALKKKNIIIKRINALRKKYFFI